jgi:glucose-6-phosphate dehydrogenase assembly protein OpcA
MHEDVTIRDIERELGRLREEMTDPDEPPSLRTSSMTHIAWVPEPWERAALETLAGLAERHPSRGILLFPRPDARRDTLDAEVYVRCFRNEPVGREVCAEVIVLWLNGARAAAPASVVTPLLVSDLPVFLRWRGELPDADAVERHASPLQQLVGVVDRMVVDSREWAEPARGFDRLRELLDRIAVSDIAWVRTRPWREAAAALWPDVADAATLRVAGPEAEALLLSRWLSARLGREVELVREPAAEIEAVEVDGRAAVPRGFEQRSPSELLSEQLDLYGRDSIYEEAIRSFSPAPT